MPQGNGSPVFKIRRWPARGELDPNRLRNRPITNVSDAYCARKKRTALARTRALRFIARRCATCTVTLLFYPLPQPHDLFNPLSARNGQTRATPGSLAAGQLRWTLRLVISDRNHGDFPLDLINVNAIEVASTPCRVTSETFHLV